MSTQKLFWNLACLLIGVTFITAITYALFRLLVSPDILTTLFIAPSNMQRLEVNHTVIRVLSGGLFVLLIAHLTMSIRTPWARLVEVPLVFFVALLLILGGYLWFSSAHIGFHSKLFLDAAVIIIVTRDAILRWRNSGKRLKGQLDLVGHVEINGFIQTASSTWKVVDRCKCSLETFQQIRWDCLRVGRISDVLIDQKAILRKDWIDENKVEWYFSQQVPTSEIKVDGQTVTNFWTHETSMKPPTSVSYSGRHYELDPIESVNRDRKAIHDQLTVLSYWDSSETCNVIIEINSDGLVESFEGGYENGADFRVL